MFRSILGSSITRTVAFQSKPQYFVGSTLTGVRFNSNDAKFDQLKSIFNNKEALPKTETTKSTLNIDELLNNSIPDTNTILNSSEKFSLHEKFGFEQSREPSPREVAKNIRQFGTYSGRVVDVHYNNVSRSFGQVKRLVNENKIRYLQKVQSRYIRPAKYRKQLKREWWRRKFQAGFRDLLHQVNDARRRGY
ncbi:MRP21 37S ribosomal protein MRP21 [Candida maltosa Xu316]